MYSQFIKYLKNITYIDPLSSEINLQLCLKLIENNYLDELSNLENNEITISIINEIKNSSLTYQDKIRLYNHLIYYNNYIMNTEDFECLYKKKLSR